MLIHQSVWNDVLGWNQGEEMNLVDNMVLTYKIEDVLNALKKNREEHMAIYNEAIENFWKTAEKKAEEFFGKVKNREGGSEKRITFNINVPQHHLAEYDTVIKMLEMTKESEIALSQSQVNQYIMDRWGFQENFLCTVSGFSDMSNVKYNRMY